MAASSWRIADGDITVEVVVPPNTTAHVTLPGGQPITVGSGTHRWSAPHTDARADSAPLTLDSMLGEVADRPGALRVLTDAIVGHLPELAEHVEAGLGAAAHDMTVREAIALIPGGEHLPAEIEAGFARLSED
ncbi:hypothetical protein LDL49_40925 [Nonomuraea sp. NEAU-L178]|nr:hypothetical protein [Nonomuraea aurantiaca]